MSAFLYNSSSKASVFIPPQYTGCSKRLLLLVRGGGAEKMAQRGIVLFLWRLAELSLRLLVEVQPRASWVLTLHTQKKWWLLRVCLLSTAKDILLTSFFSPSPVWSIQCKIQAHPSLFKKAKLKTFSNSEFLRKLSWICFPGFYLGMHGVHWQVLISSGECSLIVRL